MDRVEMNHEAGAAESDQPAVPAPEEIKPGGIGTGVAFDWGLSVQLLIDAGFFLLGVGPASDLATASIAARLVPALGSLVAAGLVFTQGEALRRGRRPARIIQIVANALLTIFGLVQIPDLVSSLQAGRFSSLIVEAILLIASPLIVFLLTRPRTRAWFATTTSAQARARHSGRWLFWMAVYALLGGAAVAFASYY
jgi:hypothetical protein